MTSGVDHISESKAYAIRRAGLIGALIAGATIAGAWAFELIGGLAPCPLCLTQRLPYYAGLPVACVAVAFALRPSGLTMARAALLLFGLIMLISAGLGVYHSGVEWKWWPGPSDCAAGAGGDATLSIQDLQTQLEGDVRVIACDEAAWRFLGLSLAGWNALISVAVAGLVFRALRSTGKRQT